MGGELWIPEAIDLKPSGWQGTMSRVGPPRCTAHVTVSPSGARGNEPHYWFERMDDVLTAKKAEPHLLYDPKTDRLGQYFPLNTSARALVSGTHSISHNKTGLVNIQIEFVADTDDFTRTWKPGKNFRAMMRAIRSWGIPDKFSNPVPTSYANPNRQSWDRWLKVGGWWNHGNVPKPESHWDCGPISTTRFFAAASTPEPPVVLVPVRKDLHNMVLFRVKGAKPVFAGNGVEFQWVQDPEALTNVQKIWGQVGYPTKIAEANSLKGCGTLVGPKPPGF